jgi:Fe-S-cluster containining protein
MDDSVLKLNKPCVRCGWCCENVVVPIGGGALNEIAAYRGVWIYSGKGRRYLVIPCACRYYLKETNGGTCTIYDKRPDECRKQTCPPMSPRRPV